jgi:hypothetical protein
MIIKSDRTSSYIATVDLKSPDDQVWIKTIRKAVKELNAFHKSKGRSLRQYVKLQGRGHRMGVRQYNQGLPLQFADTADIYVYNR